MVGRKFSTVGDFNPSLAAVDRTSRQEVSKDKEKLSKPSNNRIELACTEHFAQQ